MEVNKNIQKETQKTLQQKNTPGYLQNVVKNLPKMPFKAVQMLLPVLLNLGLVSPVEEGFQYTPSRDNQVTQNNPLNQDSIQTSSNINGIANVNVIRMPDGKCYITNDHVKVDKVGLSEFRTMQKRYDIKVFEKPNGTKKINCKEQLLKLVKYQTNPQLNEHLKQNPQLELHTLHSSQKPNNTDYRGLGRIPFSDQIKETEQVLKGEFLFGTSSNFYYAIKASANNQTAPGTSAGGLYDINGEFIGMHTDSSTLLNLKLYSDLLNPAVFNLNDLLDIAIIPDSNDDEQTIKIRSIKDLQNKLVNKLIESNQLTDQSKTGYNKRLISSLVAIISEEIKEFGYSKTVEILKTADLQQITNNGIDLEILSYQEQINNTQDKSKKEVFTERKLALEQNRQILSQRVLAGDQIVVGVQLTKQTLEPLELKP